MRYILHIDTSTDTALVALAVDGVCLAVRASRESRNHAAMVNLLIDELLGEVGISLADLCAVSVCAGPGSYTGLRIGMATAKGLCYVLDIPLILDNKLHLLAHSARTRCEHAYELYVALLVAREKEYFIAIYDNDMNCIVEPQHILEEQLKDLVGTGSRVCVVTDVPRTVIDGLSIKDSYIDNMVSPDMDKWAMVDFEKYICNDIVNLSMAEPFYLKQVYTRK